MTADPPTKHFKVAPPSKYNICMPITVRDALNEWLRQQGYIWEGKPSVSMFCTALNAGAWRRRSFKKCPIGVPQDYSGKATFSMPNDFYLQMRAHWAAHYKANWWFFWDLIQPGRWKKV